MYIALWIPKDNQPRPASKARAYKFRHETLQEASEALEASAKSRPETKFTGVVIEETTMKIVRWTKYAPSPLVNWTDVTASDFLQ